MFLEIVAVVAVAFAACGSLLLIAKAFRIKLPRWAIPLTAGLAMVAVTISVRYTWADRLIGGLPAQVVVIDRYHATSWLEPWSYVVPRVNQLLVLDHGKTRTNPEHPEIRLVTLALVEQHSGTLEMTQFIDCQRQRRVVVTQDLQLDAEGLPSASSWIEGGEPQTLYRAACSDQGSGRGAGQGAG